MLADAEAFAAAVAALGLPACDGAAGAGPPALCWQGFAAGASSTLAARVLDDLAALAASLPAPPAPANGAPPASAESPWCDPPYPGLNALTEQEAPIFFGREAECDRLVARLRAPSPRCCAIVGRSGTGKSSLVRAGVWPRLARLFPDWHLLRVRPAEAGPAGPFASLAAALAAHPAFARRHLHAARLVQALREPNGLANLLESQLFRRGDPPRAALFLFIDQFEELFQSPDPAEQAAFVACLAAGVGHPRLCLVLTLRSDFLAQALDLPTYVGLHNRAMHNRANLTLSPPDRSARLAMIQGPAARTRFALEDGLAEQIAIDTGEEPGALPLMAYTLERLYQARDGHRRLLTWDAYQALGGAAQAAPDAADGPSQVGGVQGAIGHYAGQVYADVAQEQGRDAADAVFSTLFRELVHVEDPERPPTRRPVRRAALCAGDPLAAVLADRLIAARLLVPDGKTEQGADQGLVDLAHEALLQHWPQLRDWINGRKEQLRLRGELERAVRDWRRGGDRTADLRPGRAADMAQALAALGLTPSEEQRAFLDPDARAAWLLAQDLAAWQAAGESDDALWDADRFENFGGLQTGPAAGAAAPLLPALDGARRRFLLCSFSRVLRDHPEDPHRRVRCGDALAALGDPRFDPARWWLPADATCGFREVPAGWFLMGSPAGEGEAAEQPQHAVELPTFWIGRWPVTVAQFRAFIDERGEPPEEPDSLRAPANQPVISITWNEARAYAAWLGERLRERALDLASVGAQAAASDLEAARLWQAVAAGEVRLGLPSEAEWEKAARGPQGLRYPWGDEITPARANYRATGLGRPSAVGCFPAGAGPYGCEDQAGNVWEWTRSLWGQYSSADQSFGYPYDRSDGREDPNAEPDIARVLRGGWFACDEHKCQCHAAVRTHFHPNRTSLKGGVRLAWSPFL